LYGVLFILAPIPRDPLPSEKTYITTAPSGKTTPPLRLPCWHDTWVANRKKAKKARKSLDEGVGSIEAAEVLVSVVIPAYNEEKRLESMLVEAIEYLDTEFGRSSKNPSSGRKNGRATGSAVIANGEVPTKRGATVNEASGGPSGYEIILIDDGSKDKTVDVALLFSQKHQLHDIMRIVKLQENRGKGGAVIHGFRHVRGEYAIFADADGASTFSDLGKLIEGCKEVHDRPRRGIAVGSRAHMVGTEAVVKVSLRTPYKFGVVENSC
jgi:dolichyl-phosphate beta-glucosyltransferase